MEKKFRHLKVELVTIVEKPNALKVFKEILTITYEVTEHNLKLIKLSEIHYNGRLYIVFYSKGRIYRMYLSDIRGAVSLKLVTSLRGLVMSLTGVTSPPST